MRTNILKKIVTVSKYVLFGTVLQCILFSSMIASDTQAQTSMEDIYISLKAETLSIPQVFSKIETNTAFSFAYRRSIIDKNTQIEYTANGETSLANVLRIVAKQSGLKFRRIDNVIHVSKTENQVVSVEEILGLPNQSLSVSGRVTSSDSPDGLPGVNVVVKGTTQGTVTDMTGQYTLEVPGSESIIVFSSVGYLSEEVTIGTRTIIDMSLTPDVTALDEIVVVGFGTQKRSDLTGAITSVKGETLKNLPVRSVAEALQGRVAGVMVSKGNGKPGQESDIVIRGHSSINKTPPLWIVDGVPMGTGNNFNIRDIESIEVLKDASAGIYGAEAAGGVILVTTKRGAKDGTVNIDFNAVVGQRDPLGLPNLLGRDDHIQYRRQALDNAGLEYPAEWDDPSTVANMNNTNWRDVMFSGSGLEQEYNLGISGGSEKSSFYISGNYGEEQGVFVDTWFKRYSARVNSDFRISKRIKIGETIYLNRTENNPTQSSDEIRSVFRITPMDAVYDPTNPLGGWARVAGGGGNPLGLEKMNHMHRIRNNFIGSAFAEVEIVKGLVFNPILTASVYNNHDEDFIERYDFGGLVNTEGRLDRRMETGYDLRSIFFLTYTTSFGESNLKLMAGHEAQKGEGYKLSGGISGFEIPYSRSFALSTSASPRAGGDYDIKTRKLSQFGRVNYDYKGKYIFTAQVRRDGISLFGSEEQYGVFPSVAAAWRLIDENFIISAAPFMSDLKLRVSHGLTGNSGAIDPYSFTTRYRTGNSYYTFDGSSVVTGISVANFGNEGIKWETVTQTNIGLDFGIFDNKLTGAIDYYVKQTEDMIYQVGIPAMVGVGRPNTFVTTVPTNIGTMRNNGLDVALNYQNNIGEFNFGITAIAGYFRNEITMLNLTEGDILNAGNYGLPGISGSISRTQAGQPMGQFYGYIVDGIFTQETLDAANAAAPGGIYYLPETRPGDFIYRDLDGDGRVNENDDRTFIGNPWPDLTYGLRMNFDYKGLDFSLAFDGVLGVDIYNAAVPVYQGFFADYNSTTNVKNAWTEQNPNTTQPRNVYGDPNGNYTTVSSYKVEDGSYMRLRNIQIGYTLPGNLTERAFIRRARVYVSGQNLLTFTNYSGSDPEIAGDPTSRGIDRVHRYPQTRFLSMGLELSF